MLNKLQETTSCWLEFSNANETSAPFALWVSLSEQQRSTTGTRNLNANTNTTERTNIDAAVHLCM
jgi:hypothetical protein